MSLRLAEKTDFSPSFTSQVEHGQASPSISSMERIALALGVTLGEFFQWTEKQVPLVVRVGERHGLNSEWSKAKIEALGPLPSENKLEAVMVTLFPDGASAKHPTARPLEEFAMVFAGTVTLTLGDEPDQVLETGDAASIRAGVPRRWQNTFGTGPDPCRHRPLCPVAPTDKLAGPASPSHWAVIWRVRIRLSANFLQRTGGPPRRAEASGFPAALAMVPGPAAGGAFSSN